MIASLPTPFTENIILSFMYMILLMYLYMYDPLNEHTWYESEKKSDNVSYLVMSNTLEPYGL